MDLEEEAYDIIKKHTEGVFQNVIWKELQIDSRKCSRIIKKLLDKDLIIREVGVSNGARTYLLRAKKRLRKNMISYLQGKCFQFALAVPVTASPNTVGG